MIRITIDTNLYISALLSSGGTPAKLLQLVRAGKVRLAVSDAILDEVADVLGRKFGWPPEDILDARTQILEMARKVTPATILDIVKDDPDDNRILECAVAAGSDYVVTGDKHLLRLGQYDSIRIVTAREFLESELATPLA